MDTDRLGLDAETIFKALACEAIEVNCLSCGISESVLPLDGELDESFLANYRCHECEDLELQSFDA